MPKENPAEWWQRSATEQSAQENVRYYQATTDMEVTEPVAGPSAVPAEESLPRLVPQSFSQAPSYDPFVNLTEDELNFLDSLVDDMDTTENNVAAAPVPEDADFMFSEADMEVLANVADELLAAISPDVEVVEEVVNVLSFSEADMIAHRNKYFPSAPNTAASYSQDSSSLPTLPMGRGLADCGQHASGSNGGAYFVGTVALDNSVSPLNCVSPRAFQRTFALTRDQFVASITPARAQGIAFLIEATGAFHYGRLNPDGSVSQTDANFFGLLNSEREGIQRSTMDVVTLENKKAFALYCDMIYGEAGVYFYVYFN
ncbi:hypothetical protein J4N42_19890 [Vibrio sp. SCSIO 43135]|uniref:hypothetical protein n=1 Tax=Vibrio sp. SCSIO 43135 TaxID=2819096 RepID=UPI0020764416|nr:hypothetical protein [Vibrio sp. SCSIO 43135]USD42877.1 hypothetical protein J4N42_19890 [Vibrio sp. SCSIO 43135]